MVGNFSNRVVGHSMAGHYQPGATKWAAAFRYLVFGMREPNRDRDTRTVERVSVSQHACCAGLDLVAMADRAQSLLIGMTTKQLFFVHSEVCAAGRR